MTLRRIPALTLVAALALTTAACGKEGSPDAKATSESGAAAKLPTYAVAKDVTLSGSPTFDAMTKRGKVVIGAKDDQPNLGEKSASGEYTGFDVEIARYIAAGLGFGTDKIQFKTVVSQNRETAIGNGEIDYYVGTYTINDKRKKQVSFAGPYFVAGQDLLVRADEKGITGPESLDGKKVCSASGSTPIQRIKSDYPKAKPVEFEKYSLCVQQLMDKQVDAVTTDDAILKGYAAQDPDNLKVVGKPFSKEPYGVGLAKDDKVLRNKIDDLLQKAMDDGTWTKIYDATLGRSGSKATPPAIERY